MNGFPNKKRDGTNTSDATAAASDILAGDTAYVKGQKIIGTMPNQGGPTLTPLGAGDTLIPTGYYQNAKVAKGYAVGAAINSDNIIQSGYTLGQNVFSTDTSVTNGFGIAIDEAGNSFVTYNNDSSQKVVRKLSPTGSELMYQMLVGYGRFIAVDSTGNFYVTYGWAAGNKNVVKYNSAGTEVWYKTDIGNPTGIAVDNNGYVYIAYQQAGIIRKLDNNGNEIWRKTDVPNPYKLTVDSAGNVYVACYTASIQKFLLKLNSAGVEVWSKSDVANAIDVAVDSLGNVYVVHNFPSSSYIETRKLDSSGNVVWELSSGVQTAAIDISPTSLYTAHYNTNSFARLRKINPVNGSIVWQDNTSYNYANDVAVNSKNEVVLVNNNGATSNVRKFSGVTQYYVTSN